MNISKKKYKQIVHGVDSDKDTEGTTKQPKPNKANSSNKALDTAKHQSYHIAYLRNRARLSIVELSLLLTVHTGKEWSTASISRWESDDDTISRNPSISALYGLSKVFKVPVYMLYANMISEEDLEQELQKHPISGFTSSGSDSILTFLRFGKPESTSAPVPPSSSNEE